MSMKEYVCMLDTADEEPIRILAPDYLDAEETYKHILLRRGYSANEIKLHQIIVEEERK